MMIAGWTSTSQHIPNIIISSYILFWDILFWDIVFQIQNIYIYVYMFKFPNSHDVAMRIYVKLCLMCSFIL